VPWRQNDDLDRLTQTKAGGVMEGVIGLSLKQHSASAHWLT
jgi:hypothetical protein